MLRVEGLSVKAGDTRIIQQISFELMPGEITALLGPNGAGKTTLLKAVSGLFGSERGAIYLDDEPLEKMPPAVKARKIGVMPQVIPEIPYCTVEEVVTMGRFPYFRGRGKPAQSDKEKVAAIMEETGVAGLAHRLLSSLSGGEKQRVFLAKTLAQETSLLLLDEPLANMDLHFQWESMSLLTRFCRIRKAMVLVTLHDLNLAGAFADKVVFLHQGRIAGQGKKETVLTPSFLSGIYHLDIRMFRHGDDAILGVARDGAGKSDDPGDTRREVEKQ